MTGDEFGQLLAKSESDSLDWKLEFPGPLLRGSGDPEWEQGKATLLKDLVSLANSAEATEGFLVFGVKDDRLVRTVLGISKSWDDADFQQWVLNAFDPPFRFVYEQFDWNGANIGVFRVPQSSESPHVIKRTIGNVLFEGQVWFRRGTRNSVALHDDLKAIFSPVEPFKIGGLNDAIVNTIKQHYAQQGEAITQPLFSDKDSLIAQGFKLAYWPPTSKREIWIGHNHGRYDHVMLLKPKP